MFLASARPRRPGAFGAEAGVAFCARSVTHLRDALPRVLVVSLAPAVDAADLQRNSDSGHWYYMTIRWKVALVEDDRRLARAVSAGLGEEGYTVRSVDSADRGLQLVRQWNPDVVLLDLMLPDNDGPELFQAFRAETDAALVGISARASVSDRIAGLKLGADDYVGKPFALEELMARVEAVIRRHRGNGGSRLVVGDVSLDLSEGIAERGGRALGLTGIEFRILAALMRNRGRLVTYAQLAEAVWAQDAGPESNSLEVHVSRIRQKLEAGGEPRLVHTVRGIGYRFNPED